MKLAAISTWLPVWEDGRGRRILGSDEDGVTAAIAAGSLLLDEPGTTPPDRVVFVNASPDSVGASRAAVVLAGLDLSLATGFEERLGGAATTLDTLVSVGGGTLVLAVDPHPSAGAAAALIAGGGSDVVPVGRRHHSLPTWVQAIGEAVAHEYDDVRLLREQGWRPAVEAMAQGADTPLVIVGIPIRAAVRLRSDEEITSAIPVTGAAGPLFALAEITRSRQKMRLIAIDGGDACAADVSGDAAPVLRSRVPEPTAREGSVKTRTDGEIPLSLAAFDRAFDAKVGLQAERCECGEISYPPRIVCLNCGQEDASTPYRLPSEGEIYSVVTVHTPVPGMETPYSLAIVVIGGDVARVLAPVTDVLAGSARIGDRGHLVVRRLATRQGVADYGRAFIPAGGGR